MLHIEVQEGRVIGQLRLFNLQGAEVRSAKNPAKNHKLTISTIDLAPGIYLLRCDLPESQTELIKVLITR